MSSDENAMPTEVPAAPKLKRKRKKKRSGPPRVRVCRDIEAVMVTKVAECESPVYCAIPEFPVGTKKMSQALEWAKRQAEKGRDHIRFFRVLGEFKAKAQTVMKFEIT